MRAAIFAGDPTVCVCNKNAIDYTGVYNPHDNVIYLSDRRLIFFCRFDIYFKRVHAIKYKNVR